MARVYGVLTALFFLCSLAYAQTNPINVDSIDGGNVLHPDVIYFPEGEDGYKLWMTHTPFPEQADEQIWIVRSNDGINYVETGITNPVINNSKSAASNYSGRNWAFDADPDMLYISEYSKWFIVWGPYIGSNEFCLAFAYSSDGKTWTQYDGASVNGNTAPCILSGTTAGGTYSQDSNAQGWENDSAGKGRTQYPTMIFDDDTNTFTVYYASSEDPNRSPVGCATFTWDNVDNDVENMTRCNSGNYLFYLSANGTHQAGIGHMDVWTQGSDFKMTGLRHKLVQDFFYDLVELTSSDGLSWTLDGVWKAIGSTGEWDGYSLYRGGAIHDGTGEAVLFGGSVGYVYSAYEFYNNTGIGVLNIDEFLENFETRRTTLDGVQISGGATWL